MSLTVKDILEKTFKRSFKGYDEDEVDKFLDQIIDEFKVITDENAALREQLDTAYEQVKKIKHSEETIMKTLVSAQKTAERIVGEATRKAELIISSAESTAKERVSQTTQELSSAQSRLEELKSCAQGFAASFANMINAQAAYFEKTYSSYFGQDAAPLGGINTDALNKIDRDVEQSLKDIGIQIENGNVLEPVEDEDEAAELTEDENEPAELIENESEEAEQDNTERLADDDAEFASEVSTEVNTEDTPLSADDILPDEADDRTEVKAEEKSVAEGDDGFMELHEINRALDEIENADFSENDQKEQPDESAKQIYGDFSWLYDTAEKPESTALKDPKEEEELKSLIDEVIE